MSTPKTFIIPTVGRVVWFHPDPRSAEANFATHRDVPYAAIVAHVWSDALVNLSVFDANGATHPRTSVRLIQDGDIRPDEAYCEWMPYQKGQAKAQSETKIYADGTIASGTPPLPERSPAQQDAVDSVFEARGQRSGLDFGGALRALKQGERVARAGWNGKGMFVYMVPAANYPAQTGAAKAHFGEGSMVPYNAYFALKGVDGAISTWVPSITDTLAEDWALLA